MARPKAPFDATKVAAVKEYGVEQYVNDLLGAFRLDCAERVERFRDLVKQEEELRGKLSEEEWDTTYREELATARAALGVATLPPTKPKPQDIP